MRTTVLLRLFCQLHDFPFYVAQVNEMVGLFANGAKCATGKLAGERKVALLSPLALALTRQGNGCHTAPVCPFLLLPPRSQPRAGLEIERGRREDGASLTARCSGGAQHEGKDTTERGRGEGKWRRDSRRAESLAESITHRATQEHSRACRVFVDKFGL